MLKFLVFLCALVPTVSFAQTSLNESDIKSLIRVCFTNLHAPAGHQFAVDRSRLARLGFQIVKDVPHRFEAVTPDLKLQGTYYGVEFEIRRHNRKPEKLLHKGCGLTRNHRSIPGFTRVSAGRVQALIEAEAKRNGYAPFFNKKREVLWKKGGTIIKVAVSADISGGTSYSNLGKSPLSDFWIQGAHPKDLR